MPAREASSASRPPARDPAAGLISWATAAATGVAGLVVGDYVTVLTERAPVARTVSGSFHELTRHPAGECPRCAAGLAAADLIPLAAWARTGGTCRHCGQDYGAWHPGAEILTAVTFALIGLGLGPSPALPAFCFLAAISVALVFIDVAHRRLPDLLTLPSYPVAIVALGAAAPFVRHGAGHLVHAAIGLAVALAFYLVLALIYPAGIGWGDSLTELRRCAGRAASVTERGCFFTLRAVSGA